MPAARSRVHELPCWVCCIRLNTLEILFALLFRTNCVEHRLILVPFSFFVCLFLFSHSDSRVFYRAKCIEMIFEYSTWYFSTRLRGNDFLFIQHSITYDIEWICRGWLSLFKHSFSILIFIFVFTLKQYIVTVHLRR